MNHLIVHDEAEFELWQAVDYYESKCVGLGLDFVNEVSRAFANIQKTPNQWPIGENGTRYRLLRRFPYTIHYIEFGDAIWIVAVAHMSRRPDYWHNRDINR